MPENMQGSPHRVLGSQDLDRGGLGVGASASLLGGVLSDLEQSRERGWGRESAQAEAGWENADLLMPTPPRTTRLTPLPAVGLRGRDGF
jgi:hypothetical protein